MGEGVRERGSHEDGLQGAPFERTGSGDWLGLFRLTIVRRLRFPSCFGGDLDGSVVLTWGSVERVNRE